MDREGIPHAEIEEIPHAEIEEIPHAEIEEIPHAEIDEIPHAETDETPHAETGGIPHEETGAIVRGETGVMTMDETEVGRLVRATETDAQARTDLGTMKGNRVLIATRGTAQVARRGEAHTSLLGPKRLPSLHEKTRVRKRRSLRPRNRSTRRRTSGTTSRVSTNTPVMSTRKVGPMSHPAITNPPRRLLLTLSDLERLWLEMEVSGRPIST